MKRILGTTIAFVLATGFQLPAEAAPTRIQFARGSHCGSYSGDFTNGKEFVLRLGAGQVLTSRNTGQGYQQDFHVRGKTGIIPPQGGVYPDTIEYHIPVTGDYYILVGSHSTYSKIEFCAY